jgi:hypothetical protein
MPDDTALLDNHLAFLASHRGVLTRTDQAIELAGRADFLSCWLPLTTDVPLPPTAPTVRLVPWSGPGWPERLQAAGFETAFTSGYYRKA